MDRQVAARLGVVSAGSQERRGTSQVLRAPLPLVEADSTYYYPPSEKNSELWAKRTPDNFTFNIKAFSLLTGHPTKTEALYKDLDFKSDKKNVYIDDLDQRVVDEVWDRFLSALEPLQDAGKLGLLLFQFPPWFVIGKTNKQYVLECATRAAPMRICVEFRNQTWMREDNQKETLEFLEGHGLPYVCVDMPQGFKSSIPPVVAATADVAVMRFHGHNVKEWESGSVQRRFKYLYSKDELERWAPRPRPRTGNEEDPRANEQLLQGLRTAKCEGASRSAA